MYILAIDQGTTSSRCLLFDDKARVVAQAAHEFPQVFRSAGWVEHDAHEIYDSVQKSLQDLLAKSGVSASEISCIGITNQRETTVVWNRQTGEPVAPAIVWQSRQSAAISDAWRDAGLTDWIREKTGLLPDSYFSASKLVWLFQQHPELKPMADRGELAFGTIDSWLLYKLSGHQIHATDVSNASRTMLFNIDTCTWDQELLQKFDIPASILPEVLDNTASFGMSHPNETGGFSIPITGMAGDQQAALFGQACFEPGMAKNTYGTGCFMLLQTGKERVISERGLLSTIAWRIHGEVNYALEGSVFVAGSAIQWLRDELGIIRNASETEALASSVKDSDGVFFVPAFVGLGAPYWDSEARGAFFGLTRGTSRAHLVRAALEAMAFQTRDVFDLMREESGIALKTLRVDGGAAANNLMMQFQSDVLGVDVDRPREIETTALGAALLAGLGHGIWTLEGIKQLRASDQVFHPAANDENLSRKYAGWKRAVQATRSFHG